MIAPLTLQDHGLGQRRWCLWGRRYSGCSLGDVSQHPRLPARAAALGITRQRPVKPRWPNGQGCRSLGGVAQPVRALPCHGRGHGFKPRRHRARVVQRKNTVLTWRRGTFGSCRGYSSSHGVTDSTRDYESLGEGSSPSGSAQARLAQWQSAASTPRRQRSDSVAEYCGRFRSQRGARS